ncbi:MULTISPECIES: NUDIX domain-containing protein [unclassified Fusibacter]|uniref:NUDIX domain-containing protein n=1 Tax=unclassified Fusibacter TaxID=2624464 RepID=UPI0010101CD5|nr:MULTISPECIES: NUDIX domain-containing protein [unclassified Fusibacter]MCK8058732.1 NUDIX domain-containing protein [Fusibacter sp. A2]NPE21806.1 NUDIX domain-containing protein [Fusibacter sp. A1]RXV61378.1 NUDIX domain-containing protein [Fusibacter sp. A1]
MSNYRLSSRGIVIHDEHILLNEFDHGAYYNIPGGGVEAEETLRDACVRELLEESGYTVITKELLYMFEYNPVRDEFLYGSRGGIGYVFRCELVDPTKRVEPSVIDGGPVGSTIVSTGAKWIPLDKLGSINLVPPIAQKIISDYEKQVRITQFLEDIH